VTREGGPARAQANWAPAETIGDYMRNCREGLEVFSERRAAKLMGWSRAHMRRVTLMAELPEDLFEALLEGLLPHPSNRELANIALALRGGNTFEPRYCPHCGGLLRVGRGFSDKAWAIVTSGWGGSDAGAPCTGN
jgi:hypothetical protein